MNKTQFQRCILQWHKTRNRGWLPWRRTRNPYAVIVSEVMLQQTQVSRVEQKYPEFLRAFPTVRDLARAPLQRILRVWQGMGYNRRALYLKRLAHVITTRYGGNIPSGVEELKTLPGIGSYSAGAIACFAFSEPVAFLDTNIRKVYLYHFFQNSEKKNSKISDGQILPIARRMLYAKDPRTWHYALMDYGALELGRDRKLLERSKAYHKQSPFAGSTRYFRSRIVRHLLEKERVSGAALERALQYDPDFSEKINIPGLLFALEKESMIKQNPTGYYSIRQG